MYGVAFVRARARHEPHWNEANQQRRKDDRRIHTKTLQSRDPHWLIHCVVHCLYLCENSIRSHDPCARALWSCRARSRSAVWTTTGHAPEDLGRSGSNCAPPTSLSRTLSIRSGGAPTISNVADARPMPASSRACRMSRLMASFSLRIPWSRTMKRTVSSSQLSVSLSYTWAAGPPAGGCTVAAFRRALLVRARRS